MITYNRGAFGLNLLFRIHGSAVYRSVVPSLVSVGIFLFIRNLSNNDVLSEENLGHPYAIGVLVASTTFLIVFRANQGYSRYWEAAGATHHMMSKWMDATSHSGIYHMQCDHYKDIKPPSYFDYPELNKYNLTRARERGRNYDESEVGGLDDDVAKPMSDKQMQKHMQKRRSVRMVVKSINFVEDQKTREAAAENNTPDIMGLADMAEDWENEEDLSRPLLGRGRLDGNLGGMYNDGRATFFDPNNPDKIDPKGFASTQGGRTPHLFLQELAHLSSLLVAVALSTLRNDIEGAASPLAVYEPGSPWPEVDPDKDEWLKLNGCQKVMQHFLSFLGVGKTPEERTRYNAGRPLPVIGGVSDNEIRFLQMARGPYAKTQLCWSWLSEFCIREHLAGSMGKVGPPIISRIIQFLGDGMIYYNHARKIMFIPFPFVHAQLSVLFVIVMVPAIPYLMDQYTNDAWLGSILSFFTILCLSGIHEVARELENPFRNVPNELPLVTLQAQYNEALLTMFSGFHPDHFWDGERMTRKYGGLGVLSSPSPPPQEEAKRPDQTPLKPNASAPQTASIPPSPPVDVSSPSDQEEITELRRQLEEQSKMIAKLAAQIHYRNPSEETKNLEEQVFQK